MQTGVCVVGRVAWKFAPQLAFTYCPSKNSSYRTLKFRIVIICLVTSPNANFFPLLDQNVFKFWLLMNEIVRG